MLVIAILISLTTFVLLLLTHQYLVMEKQVTSERLSRYVRTVEQAGGKGRLSPGIRNGSWRDVVRYLGRYASAPRARYFDGKMLQAGILLKGSEFIVLSLGFSVLVGLAALLLTKGGLGAGIAVGIVAYLLTLVYINVKIARRLAAFNGQLGDALSLMANALRSGFSFFQAVEMVSKEMPVPISSEFTRALKEMNLGVATEEVLSNLTTRVSSDDLSMVVTAVLIQRQIGGNLAQILDNIATTIRERSMMKKEIRTLTAQGRLSGWVVGLLPLVMIFAVSAINPGYIGALFTEPLGQMLLAGAGVSQLVGVVFIRRIVDIDV